MRTRGEGVKFRENFGTRLAHEVGDARLLVVVELEEPLAPLVPVEVLDLLELLPVQNG